MGGPSSALLKLMHLLAYLIVKTRYGTMLVVLVTVKGPQWTVSTEGGGDVAVAKTGRKVVGLNPEIVRFFSQNMLAARFKLIFLNL